MNFTSVFFGNFHFFKHCFGTRPASKYCACQKFWDCVSWVIFLPSQFNLWPNRKNWKDMMIAGLGSGVCLGRLESWMSHVETSAGSASMSMSTEASPWFIQRSVPTGRSFETPLSGTWNSWRQEAGMFPWKLRTRGWSCEADSKTCTQSASLQWWSSALLRCINPSNTSWSSMSSGPSMGHLSLLRWDWAMLLMLVWFEKGCSQS